MPEDSRQKLDDMLDLVSKGAEARGAREYVSRYMQGAKEGIFQMLTHTKPDLDNLLKVWAWAVGLDQMDQDLKLAIERGKDAREQLNPSPENLDNLEIGGE